MLRKSILLLLFFFAYNAQAQHVGAGLYDSYSVEEWRQDTIFVIVYPEYPEYNEVIKNYMDSNWTLNEVAYIDRELVDDEDYREEHEKKVVLSLVILNDQDMSYWYSDFPSSLETGWMALAIVELENLYTPKFEDKPAIIVSPKQIFAYFSFVRSIEDPRLEDTDSEEVFTTDFQVNPLHYQALIAVKSLHFLARETLNIEPGFADATFILRTRKRMNQRGRIRKKILLIDSMQFNEELKDGDVAKYFKDKYKIASSEEIYRLVKENNEDYCLLSAHSSKYGLHVSVLDLATEDIVYFEYHPRSKYLKPDHIKEVRKQY